MDIFHTLAYIALFVAGVVSGVVIDGEITRRSIHKLEV